MHRAITSTCLAVLQEPCSCVGKAAQASGGLRLIAAATAAAMPFAASAQVSTNLERAPTLTIERYSEDWSSLADPVNRKGDWTESLK